MQYAINWIREIAILKGGSMPGLYSGFVGLMRTSVASLIEAKQAVPIMFNNLDSLKAWARKQEFKTEEVDSLPADEVLRLLPTTDPKNKLTAVELYWVKANSSHYRTAMIKWCHSAYGDDHVRRAHEESINFFESLKDDLSNLPAKSHVFGRRGRTAILSLINDSILNQRSALKLGGNEKIAYQLLATLDADHVLNRASLKKIPNAWVLLLPVPADANRGFGRIVERYRTQLSPETEKIDLTPEISFKIFCGAMPRNKQELNSLRKVIAGQLQADDYVNDMCSAIETKIPRSN